MSEVSYVGVLMWGHFQVFRNGAPLDHFINRRARIFYGCNYDWGSNSSGAQLLASMLLLDATQKPPVVLKWASTFAADVVARWPREERWEITRAQIEAWLANREQAALLEQAKPNPKVTGPAAAGRVLDQDTPPMALPTDPPNPTSTKKRKDS